MQRKGTRIARRCVLALGLFLPHCRATADRDPRESRGAPASPASVSAPMPSGSEAAAASTATSPLPPFDIAPREVGVPATTGTLHVPFTLNASGHGSGVIGAVRVKGAKGTLMFHGRPLDIAVHARQPWSRKGYEVFQGVGVLGDRLLLVWLYCSAGTLVSLFYEDTVEQRVELAPAEGRCSVSDTPAEGAMTFPASTLRLRPTAPFLISGEHVSVNGAGTVELGARRYSVLPFGTVDCRTDCDDEGWQEMHALLVPASGAGACVAVLYFDLAPIRVLVTHGLCLPDLSDPAEPAGKRWLRAEWKRL